MEILDVGLEVLGKAVDALGQQREDPCREARHAERLAVAQPRLCGRVQLRSRQLAQQALERHDAPPALERGQRLQRLRAEGVAHVEAARRSAPQRTQVRHRAESLAEILGQRPDIGSLAAAHANLQQRGPQGDFFQFKDLHPARCALDALAAPRELVERNAASLERRMHRRHLLYRSAKTLQDREDLRLGNLYRLGFQHLALGVGGGGTLAELDRGEVFLVGVEQRAGELGGLSEKNQQQARGERIEGSGMAGLPRAVEPLHLLQRRVGAHPERLVEQQSAVHLLFGPDAVDELRQAIGARDRLVVLEAQLRHAVERDALRELRAQEARRTLQSLRRGLGLLRIEAGEIDQGMGHVARDIHGRDGHHADPRVVQLPVKQIGQLALDQIADFLRAPLASLHSDLATSCTSNTSSWSPSLMSEKFFSDRPHSKPALTSRASSLKRLSDSMSPVWMTTLSRGTRTCALRLTAPSST